MKSCILLSLITALSFSPLFGCAGRQLQAVPSSEIPRAVASLPQASESADPVQAGQNPPTVEPPGEISVAPLEPAEFGEIKEESIADPLEPLNRAFFHFNDKLYFWVLKPLARGYRTVVPQRARLSVRNFFSNLRTPIRFVNCVLQGNGEGAAIELCRVVVNSVLGIGGLFDPAGKWLHLKKQDEDFGQTLGVYHLGPGFYIVWPIIGPCSLRGSAGLAADFFTDPLTYLVTDIRANLGIRFAEVLNKTSLTLGEYEELKEGAIDPYIALRNAYYQYRKNKIKQRFPSHKKGKTAAAATPHSKIFE